MCKLSAVLMSMGSSFHHFGARIANQRIFADGNLGPPRSVGAASRLIIIIIIIIIASIYIAPFKGPKVALQVIGQEQT